MKSVIEEALTEEEKTALTLYRSSSDKTMRRNIRLSIQYAIAAGIFSILTVVVDANFVWLVLGIFVTWLILRIIAAKKNTSAIPKIIEKYEQEISQLKQ